MTSRALGLLASLVLAAAPGAAQNGYPRWNGNAVQDLAGVIGPRMEDSIRTLLAPARARGIDVRVVTISSMSRYEVEAATIDDFAQGMFNAWHVGDRPQNDGILLLVATGDRKVRIQLGDGAQKYESAAQQVISDSMIPHFREDRMVRGIVRGTAGIAQWFTPAGEAAFAPPPPQPAYTPQPAYSPSPGAGGGGGAGVLFGLLGVGGVGLAMAGFGAAARNRPRKCTHCGTQMVKLDEAADDVYLESGQKTEEFLGSVDYDVWKCGGCGAHTLGRYDSWFSGKSACPSCRYQTVETTKHVLQHPTYDDEGREEVLRECRHCGFHDRDVVWLPRRTRPQDTSSSPSPSSSSSLSSWSSSSSSSSGGDGGGYSSGGGASGSW
jgi:uncharacterized protein